jgi:hypothetical protein
MNATSKLVKAWESKNAKNAARAGGVSLMALSLAACGGSSEEAAPTVLKTVYDAAVTAQAAAEAEAAAAATAQTAAETAQAAAEATAAAAATAQTAAETAQAAAEADAATAATAQAAAETAQAAAEADAATAATAQAAAETAQAAAETAQAAAETAQAASDAALAAQNTAITAAGFADLDALIAAYTATLVPVTEVLTTAATDDISGTTNSDTFDASTSDSLQTGDRVTDASGTDGDVLTATVTGNAAAPTLVNVETVNLTGSALTVGMAFTNVTGTDNVTATTDLVGGTATFTDAAAASVGTITSGANVTTLDVTTLAGGTGAAGVSVVGGTDTTAINVTGGAGTDVVSVTTGVASTVTLATFVAADTVSVNTATATTVDGVAAAAIGTLNVNATADATITVTTGIGDETDFTGSGNVVLATTSAIAASATSVASTGAGTLTLQMDDVTNLDDVSVVAADIIDHQDAVGAAGLTIANASTLNLDVDVASSTFNLAAAGTLIVTVSETQTNTMTTGGLVTGLAISATADEAADTANGAVIGAGIVLLDAATNTVVVTGSENITFTELTNNGDEVFNSTAATGNVTITEAAAALNAQFGSGDDSFTSTNDVAFTLRMGEGDNTVDLDDTVATAATIVTGGGADTIIGGDAADTISAGAGNDSIDGEGGADTITTGAGSDTVTIVSGEDGDTVTDFVMGTDMLVLTGAAGAAVDLSATTPTAAAYAIDGAGGNFDVTLTGNTATDIQDSVTLGTQATAAVAAGAAIGVTTYTALTTGGATTVAGDADDVIAFGGAHSVTTGSGSDTVIAAIGNDTTVTDFVMGTDTLIITGAATASLDLTAITPTAGAYVMGADTITLTGNTVTDVSGSVVLGTAAAAFTMFATGSTTGGTGNDYIAQTGGADTVVFIDNGGVDTITGVTVTAGLLDFDSITGIAADGVQLAANAALVGDALDGEVYIFDDGTDGTGAEAIDFNGANNDAGLNSAEVLADVASFLEAGLTEANGETYVALINMTSGGASDTYVAYLIDGDTDGIDANDLTLMGTIDADVELTAAEIV